MNEDEMDEVLRSLMPEGYEPSPALLAVRRTRRRIQQIVDEVRAELGLEADERLDDLQLHYEIADLLDVEQTQEIKTWFTLRLNREIEREYEQVEAALLLDAGEFVEAKITDRKPVWLAPRVSEFLASRS